jgi:PAS domain S-box-containing protein
MSEERLKPVNGEAARERDSAYRMLFDTMAQGVVYQDASGAITSANPAAERILGLSLDQMRGRTSMDPRWRSIHEDGTDFPGATHPSMVALKTGREVHDVIMGVRRPGEDRPVWIRIHAMPLFRPGETSAWQVYTTFEDITELRAIQEALLKSRAELEQRVTDRTAELASLRQVATAVSRDLRLAEMIRASLAVIVRTTDADLAMLFLREGDRIVFQQVCQREGLPPHRSPASRQVGECLCGLAARGEPVYVDDIATDGRCGYPECRQAGMTAFAAVPLRTGADVLGVLCVASVKPRAFRRQAEFLETLARDVSLALQNSLLYEQARRHAAVLQESEERFVTLFEKAPYAVHLASLPDGVLAEVNEAFERMFGYTRHEVRGRTSRELGIQPDAEARARVLATLERGGSVRDMELSLQTKSGDRRVFSVNVDTVTIGGKRYAVSAAQDITDRKRAEQALASEIAARTAVEADLRRDSEFRQAIIARAAEGLCVCRAVEEPPYVRFSVWNERMIEITGYTMEEINRLGWYQSLYPDPEIRERAAARMARMRDGDDLRSEEWTIARKDGTQRVIAISTRILEGGFVLAMMHDLTERKRAEGSALAAEARFRAVIERSSEGWGFCDTTGVMNYQSPALRQILGYCPEELVGKRIFDYIHPDDLDHVTRTLTTQLLPKPGSVARIRYRFRHQDGSWRHLEAVASNYLELKGIESLVVNFRDITPQIEAQQARRRAEESLHAQRTQAVRADRLRSLGEMAAGIAHELNQPLSGIRALAEQNLIAMRRKWALDHAELAKELQLIVEQADRMSHIINHVRLFARQAGKPDAERTDLNEVVESCVGLVREQFRIRGIAVTLDLVRPLPAILANPFSLEEVLLNLLSNARDAVEPVHPNGDGLIRIASECARKDGRKWTRLTVRDNGPGIAPAALDRLFEPFFTTKPPDLGTGLGLSIARSIVESFGGTLNLESPPDGGALAIVLLPAAEEGGAFGGHRSPIARHP